jgi:hypothetical protein
MFRGLNQLCVPRLSSGGSKTTVSAEAERPPRCIVMVAAIIVKTLGPALSQSSMVPGAPLKYAGTEGMAVFPACLRSALTSTV